MSDFFFTSPPVEWIFVAIAWLISACIIFKILKKEIEQRRNSSILFTSKWFKYSSMICIVFEFLSQVMALLQFVPILCKFTLFLAIICVLIGAGGMGVFQLSRLYYCFANDQIHSDKGYPKCVFIFMYIMGATVVTIFIFAFCFSYFVLRSDCGYDDNNWYYIKPILYFDGAMYFMLITASLYSIWDFCTLLLYIYKVRYFQQFQKLNQRRLSTVETRIVHIMFRIIILTVLYQFGFVIIGAISYAFLDRIFIQQVLIGFTGPVVMSFSMYLMMEHNNKDYIKFLRVIYSLRLHWICLCWRGLILDQIKQYSLEEDDEQGIIEPGIEKRITPLTTTIDVPIKNHRINSTSIISMTDSNANT